jgi:hypothetical protein
MNANLLDGLREVSRFRNQVAIGLPLLGGALVTATSYFMPRGKIKGLVTGLYLVLASTGVACLFLAVISAVAGEPRSVVGLLSLLGIVLTVVMGLFSPHVIHEYQQFEFRKLAAELFRRS